YWLTLDLAANGPLCIAVDDAQWADEASLRYLTYLAQRPEGLSVLILLAMRPGPAENPPLDQLRLHPAARQLRLQRLTEEGVGKLTESREWLRRGAELAHEIGALALLDQARSELAAAGARPRRFAVSGVDALTPSELRVARMAGGGRTNREIAQSLFVTPKAIEYHLANAYRKLSISGRRELAGALGQAAGSASV
ncbi:MAG: LuxR C-terminal-related transcriptional regulator, partial [Candidatus Limnocylindria bacterium]